MSRRSDPPARSRDFQRPFDVFLSFYILKIEVVIIHVGCKLLPGVHLHGLDSGGAAQHFNRLEQRVNAVNLEVVHDSGFPGVYPGQDEALEFLFPGLYGNT